MLIHGFGFAWLICFTLVLFAVVAIRASKLCTGFVLHTHLLGERGVNPSL